MQHRIKAIDQVLETTSPADMVNKQEFADLIGISKPTLDGIIRDAGGAFPIEEPGGKGIGFVINLHQALHFMRERWASAALDFDRQREMFEAAKLELAGADAAGGMSGSQALAWQRYRREMREQQVREMQLAEVPAIRRILETIWGELGNRLEGLESSLGRRFNLSLEQRRAMADVIEGWRIETVTELRQAIDFEPEDDGRNRAA